MEKVIEIINNGCKYFHVSWNPNNGNITLTKDINEASVFKSDWDMGFIPQTKKHIFLKYPKAKINIVDKK